LKFFDDQVDEDGPTQNSLGTERLLYIFEEMFLINAGVSEVVVPAITQLIEGDYSGKPEVMEKLKR
jgi:hypothetical protein